jgi:hypothetical protein
MAEIQPSETLHVRGMKREDFTFQIVSDPVGTLQQQCAQLFCRTFLHHHNGKPRRKLKPSREPGTVANLERRSLTSIPSFVNNQAMKISKAHIRDNRVRQTRLRSKQWVSVADLRDQPVRLCTPRSRVCDGMLQIYSFQSEPLSRFWAGCCI